MPRPTQRPRRRSAAPFAERLRAEAVERVWAFDEGRFGLKVWLRRRWCPRGERPPWIYDERYEWLWVYVAVEPASGRCCALYLPHVDPACLQIFLDTFRAEVGAGRIGLILDGSGAHQSRATAWPDGLVPLRLPPYSPELNPAEQVVRHLRARLANRLFVDLDDLDDALTTALREFWDDPPRLRRLTGYPWWVDALPAIQPHGS